MKAPKLPAQSLPPPPATVSGPQATDVAREAQIAAKKRKGFLSTIVGGEAKPMGKQTLGTSSLLGGGY